MSAAKKGSKAETEAAIARIAKRFADKMAKSGMEFTSAGPGEDGTPTITFYAHPDTCASRRGFDCDCREQT